MRIRRLIWLDEIVDKLDWKHSVQPNEVRELFDNRPKFRFVEKGHRPDENVYFATGQTNSGRYLIVFFILKLNQSALILSARDMSAKERKQHERK